MLQKRDHLTRMKQARDALRMDNIRLRQKGGLVSHSALLRDFEERVDQVRVKLSSGIQVQRLSLSLSLERGNAEPVGGVAAEALRADGAL